jgi:hypothetical protein
MTQETIQSWCVPAAIHNAIAWRIKTGERTRIVIFSLDEHTNHAQAQALHCGEWVYLTEVWTGQFLSVRVYRENLPETVGTDPVEIWSVGDFIEQQGRVLDIDFREME